jgi:hypothetical protein
MTERGDSPSNWLLSGMRARTADSLRTVSIYYCLTFLCCCYLSSQSGFSTTLTRSSFYDALGQFFGISLKFGIFLNVLLFRALLICDFADYVAPRAHNLPRSRKVVKFFDIREHNIICLINALERYNWNGILLDSDISNALH